MEMIHERYSKSTWIYAFTDGSAENAIRNGGSGAYISYPDGSSVSISTPVGELSSNYTAEVQALIIATGHLAEEEGQHNIVLLTDSLSALQSLSSGHTGHITKLLQTKLNILAQSRKVTLQWIPAHRSCRQ
ncbi:uncharacterized protein LOC121391536 [Gigantopelta aegis]|uniref:uncharacterized protein LOC121391536 n=1 Tax=Gigantopelta aegis TaxID=1735272 RepID=UPI001B88BF53|nr:uncharacterized protein LOC121391536 [Gigantopelta aegis]